ncbi:Inhibitor of growth protein 5 [Chytriomyces hyalinus]|nr:Inhibitor of growth protein 5 [Chytriomyces hyalinus]
MATPTAANSNSMAYLEDYLDTIEALPLELSRNLTLMRELGGLADDIEKTIDSETKGFVDTLRMLKTPEERTEKIAALTTIFKEYLKHGEDKVALAVQTYDMVDRHIRRLDDDLAKYEDEQLTGPRQNGMFYTGEILRDSIETIRYTETRKPSNNPSVNDTPNKQGTKRKQLAREKPSTPQPETVPAGSSSKDAAAAIRKDKTTRAPAAASVTAAATAAVANKGRASARTAAGTSLAEATTAPFKNSADDLPIDPNEPRYCTCNGVSWGDMIGVKFSFSLLFHSLPHRLCDLTISTCFYRRFSGNSCEIEWFHYACVGLTEKVEGSWFCPQCRERRDKKAKTGKKKTKMDQDDD